MRGTMTFGLVLCLVFACPVGSLAQPAPAAAQTAPQDAARRGGPWFPPRLAPMAR